AVLVFAASYLATSCLLSLIGHIMRSRAASAALGIIVLALISFGPLAMSLLAVSGGDRVWAVMECVRLLQPPGAAGASSAEDRWQMAFGGAVLLCLWVAALSLILKKLESLRPGAESDYSGGISWDSFYDQVARLFGSKYAPFVGKSLRYHLRCNLVRFSLLT